MTKQRVIVSSLISFLAVALVAILHVPLSSVEDQVTSLKYSFRGQLRPDTNIVIVYIDDDAVKDLGRPVRRNFYALMVKALSELDVRAIGIDVMFEERKPEYPEYDELLAATLASSRRVVLSSYFRSVSIDGKESEAQQAEHSPFFSVKGVANLGVELHQPLDVLRANAAGVGHANLGDGIDVPLFVRSVDGVIPSFGMELLRVFKGVNTSEVRLENGRVGVGSSVAFTASDGSAKLNYPGPVSSFRSYPFLEVLKSYDAIRLDRTPSLPVRQLAGKIVLVSFVADERVFMNTPVASRYPSIGLHATFLDNALQRRFLSQPGTILVLALCLILAMMCALTIFFLKSPLDKVAAAGFPILMCCASFLLFTSSYLLPLASPVVACVVSIVASVLYKQRIVGAQVDTLHAEKDAIAVKLKEKEAKVIQLENELLETTKSAHRTTELLEEIRRYKAEIHTLSSRADDMEEYAVDKDVMTSTVSEFEGMVYDRNGKMKSVVEFIEKIARSDAAVLVLGESGTGKELIARAIHLKSGRAGKPFVAVNCGALSENLLESELFGHEKGAFTGAVKDKLGRFELADGGTIFLDEIGEVTEAFQLKLLRVLQEGELERVGGTKTIKVNVRVLAATNKDLKEQVGTKRFREDLFYRLNVLTVNLPPLRERDEDIPLLIRHFLKREGQEMRMSKNVMSALQVYRWPGNIRELESVIKRASLLTKAEQRTMVSMKDLTEEVVAASKGSVALEDQILESLREKGFSRSSVSDTADELGGLNRGTVAEYLRGQSLKAFVEQGFNVDLAVKHISLSLDEEVNERVRKKLAEYLVNIADVVNPSLSWDEIKDGLKSKTKNLPQRYHTYVEKTSEGFYRKLWKLEQ